MKRILLVDDNEEFLDLLKAHLSRQGYEVLAATNGKEALSLARSQDPDLIVLDVMMPGLDGYHVARDLSAAGRETPPKILILSGRDLDRERGILLLCGAHGMLQKPCRMEDLVAKVKGLLGEGAGQAVSEGESRASPQ